MSSFEVDPDTQMAWDLNSQAKWRSDIISANRTIETAEKCLGNLTLKLMGQASLFYGQLAWNNNQLDYI